MAFNSITQADIEVGKPVKKELFQTTKDNFDDHESRIEALAESVGKVELFIEEFANLRQYSPNNSTLSRLLLHKASRDFQITNVQVYVLHGGAAEDVAPTAGTLEIDIKKGSNLASMNTIFSIRPSVSTFGNGDTNGAFSFIPDGELVDQGEWVQFDITSLQTNQTRIFIDVFGEPI